VAVRLCAAADRRPQADVSGVTGVDVSESVEDANISAFGAKSGKGKTGVHLCYHLSDEYAALLPEQKKELSEWCKAERAKGRTFKRKGKSGGNKKPEKAKVSTRIAKEVKKQLNKAFKLRLMLPRKGRKTLKSLFCQLLKSSSQVLPRQQQRPRRSESPKRNPKEHEFYYCLHFAKHSSLC